MPSLGSSAGLLDTVMDTVTRISYLLFEEDDDPTSISREMPGKSAVRERLLTIRPTNYPRQLGVILAPGRLWSRYRPSISGRDTIPEKEAEIGGIPPLPRELVGVPTLKQHTRDFHK